MVIKGNHGGVAILITKARSFVDNPIKTTFFHAPIFYPSTKMFLEMLRAMFFDHNLDPASKFVEFLSVPMSHTRTKSVFLLQTFLHCIRLYGYNQKQRKGACKARFEGPQR